jgi:hypothetical protein
MPHKVDHLSSFLSYSRLNFFERGTTKLCYSFRWKGPRGGNVTWITLIRTRAGGSESWSCFIS